MCLKNNYRQENAGIKKKNRNQKDINLDLVYIVFRLICKKKKNEKTYYFKQLLKTLQVVGVSHQ